MTRFASPCFSGECGLCPECCGSDYIHDMPNEISRAKDMNLLYGRKRVDEISTDYSKRLNQWCSERGYRNPSDSGWTKKTVKKVVKRVVRKVPKKKTATQHNTAATTVTETAATAPVVTPPTTSTETVTDEWEQCWDSVIEPTTTLSKTVRALNTSLKKSIGCLRGFCT